MGKPRVLIVDDQKEVVRLLHSAIDSTGHEIEVIEAPSGEEALLDASQNPIDLLIVDYLLPGMSGLDLLKKVRARYPEMPSIVVTGQTSRAVHREIMNADAQAFFVKPVPMADFLDAVERCLGLIRTILPVETYANQDLQKENLTDLMINLRKKTDAQAVILLNERGLPMIRAGEFPQVNREVSLFSTLMSLLNAGNKVVGTLECDVQRQFFVFTADGYDLLVLPVNMTHLLVVAGEHFASDDRLSEILLTLNSVRAEARELLRALGIEDSVIVQEEALPASDSAAAEPKAAQSAEDDEPVAEDLAQLLENAGALGKDADSFWEEAANQYEPKPLSPDVITYEQASQLGLAPENEEAEMDE